MTEVGKLRTALPQGADVERSSVADKGKMGPRYRPSPESTPGPL